MRHATTLATDSLRTRLKDYFAQQLDYTGHVVRLRF